MSTLQNDTLIRALTRQPTPYTPVWLMRQAGRYLPEYNDARRRAGSFLALCKTPSLATEVTLQPLERFRLDAAILFSDILTIPDAMGLGLYFAEGENVDRKSTRLNSSHGYISYAVFCLKKKKLLNKIKHTKKKKTIHYGA